MLKELERRDAARDDGEAVRISPSVKQESGSKGGSTRAAKLTPEQRKAIAQKAAAKRWGKS